MRRVIFQCKNYSVETHWSSFRGTGGKIIVSIPSLSSWIISWYPLSKLSPREDSDAALSTLLLAVWYKTNLSLFFFNLPFFAFFLLLASPLHLRFACLWIPLLCRCRWCRQARCRQARHDIDWGHRRYSWHSTWILLRGVFEFCPCKWSIVHTSQWTNLKAFKKYMACLQIHISKHSFLWCEAYQLFFPCGAKHTKFCFLYACKYTLISKKICMVGLVSDFLYLPFILSIEDRRTSTRCHGWRDWRRR